MEGSDQMELGLGFEEALKNSATVAEDDDDDVVMEPGRLLTVECLAKFVGGIYAILSEWVPIREWVAEDKELLAKEWRALIKNTHQRLKHERVDQFHAEIFNFFIQSKVPLTIGALRELLFKTMLRSFRVQLHNGSPHMVACKLMDLYEECMEKSASFRGVKAPPKAERLPEGSRIPGTWP